MFQEALIESLPHRSRNAGTILASASLHALALAALGWMSWKTVGKIESPPEQVVFKIGWNPPPLGDGGQRGGAAEIRARLPRPVRAAVHPEQFQPARETARAERRRSLPGVRRREDVRERADRRKSGGFPEGVRDGHGDHPIDVIGTAEDAIVEARVDQPPVLLTRVEPVYPELARKLRLSGLVVLRAVIGRSGRVEDLSVEKSAGALLDAAATSAVEKWMYKPATLSGRPVRVLLTVSVEFSLH